MVPKIKIYKRRTNAFLCVRKVPIWMRINRRNVMRSQIVIILSSVKNKEVTREIAWGLDGGVCRVVVRDEFFNTIYGDEYMLTEVAFDARTK